jgi:NAD(P)-dependent dehydrogenase (short-subunit alcohol dehydrogenase family)
MQPKTILITGGTSGIGREAALLLATQGHNVFAASRKSPQEPMPGVTYLPLDVRSAESIRACVEAVLAQIGQVDVLVNNAGYAGPAGASEENSLDEARALFETNFFGAMQIVNAVLPAMRQRRSGLIVNVTSAAGRLGLPPFGSPYVASKHALDGYSEALSYELRPLGIRVAVIEPGYFQTNIHTTGNRPTHEISDYSQERDHANALNDFCIRYGRNPRQVAKQIASLVNGTPRRLRYPVGNDVHYLLWVRSLLPEKIFERYIRWVLQGGQTLEYGEDDATLRRKIGFRRLMLESSPADRVFAGSIIALGLLAVGGLLLALGGLLG